MGEILITKVPNLRDYIAFNKEVRLVEVIMPNLKEKAPKQHVQFKILSNNEQVELNQDSNNGLPKEIKIEKSKSKEVQAMLTCGKRGKELIHNFETNHRNKKEEIFVQNKEVNVYPLENQELIIGVNLVMCPITETNATSLGLTNGPILKSLIKVIILALHMKPLVNPMKGRPKVGRPPR
jgi:hypothetical protein